MSEQFDVLHITCPQTGSKRRTMIENMEEARAKLNEFALANGWNKGTTEGTWKFMEFAYLIGKHEGLTKMHLATQSIITQEMGLSETSLLLGVRCRCL